MLSKCGFLKAFTMLGFIWAWSFCPIYGADWKTLPGHVPRVIRRLAATGAVPATNELRLAIGLPLRDAAGLDNFLAEVADPASPNFRQYLTPEEFTERFGPTAGDYAAVKFFAQVNGLNITATHSNRLLLDVSGSAAKIERAFHLRLKKFQHPKEAREFFSPDSEPTVDVNLPIADVAGLSDYARPHTKLQHAKETSVSAKVVSKGGTGPGGGYIGPDLRAAYVPGTTLTGAGQMVGLLQFDGFYSNDIVAYENQLPGQPRVPIQTVLIDGFSGRPTTGPNSGNDEVSLDIEMAIAMAPGLAKVMVFEAPASGQPNDILNAMAAHSEVKSLSCSWGWNGNQNTTTENIFKQMAAQGQSFFNASGDSAAFLPGAVDDTSQANSPSASPNITQVGGTTLTMNGSGSSYSSEIVWNDESGTGSGGGISDANSIPTWQQGISMIANHGSTTGRNLPDVALLADNAYAVYGNGNSGAFIGTSISAPLWAGFMALVNQQAATWGYPSAGFINPAIYALGKGANYNLYFHDTTVGDNFWSSSPDDFPATTGFDLCTGWGTPNGTNLIFALAAFNPAAHLVDTIPPTLTITNPVNNLKWSNTVFTVRGTAGDNVAVSNVFYSLNGSGWTMANSTNNWANWWADVALIMGTNTVQAYAQDISGNLSITNQKSFVCILSAPLTVGTNGRGSLSPFFNGALLQIGASYSMSATAAAGFSFANWTDGDGQVVTNSATLKWTMAPDLVFTANFVDISQPTNLITAPTSGLRWSNSVFTVSGRVGDNVGVNNVFYSLNGGEWSTASFLNHSTNWNALVNLTPGTNVVQAFAVDTAGNRSTTNRVSVVYVVSAALTVNTNGRGSFSPSYNGALLQLGANYVLTATAASGFKFVNWSDSFGSPISNSSNLSFSMTPNLAYIANFADISKPTNTITMPVANQRWSNSTITVTGKAGDNVSVATVFYSLNNADWAAATGFNGWSNWTTEVSLTPGTNVIKSYAIDGAGNLSPTNQTAFVYVLNTSLTVNANGRGSFSPNYNGQLLQIGANYTLTAMAATGFKFTNWAGGDGLALTNGSTLTFRMASNLVFTANFVDSAKPTNSITLPVVNQHWSNSSFTVTGNAADNVAVANVFYSLNNSDWTNASMVTSWSNWTAAVTLTPGTNSVQSYAVDAAGNFSATNKVSFVYVLSAPLALNTNGYGSISPNYNGAMLQLGVKYSLTATPATGCTFVNWTDGQNAAVTNNSVLIFTMASNLSFTANFADVAKPVVTIVKPAINQNVSNYFFTISGKATDNVGVVNVFYSLNGNDWANPLSGDHWTNWAVQVNLVQGTNSIWICAVDAAGNVSATNKVSFVYVFTLGGLWNMVQFQTPAQVTWDNFNGLIGGNNFSETNGTIRFYPDGTLSGQFEEPFAGTYILGTNGAVTVTIVTASATNSYSLSINAAQDIMTLLNSQLDAQNNQQELIVFERAPVTNTISSMAGSWRVFQFQTPQQVTWDVTSGLQGGDHFFATNGSLIMNPNGTASGNLAGIFSGNFVLSSNGVVNLTTVALGQTNTHTLFVNASRSLMSLTEGQLDSNDNAQQLTLALKVPTLVSPADITGVWNVLQFQSPQQLTQDTNNVLSGGNFSGVHGSIRFNSNGTISGNLNGAFVGNYRVSPAGAVTLIFSANGGISTLYLNSSRDAMTGMSSGQGRQQLLILLHVPGL